MMIFITTLIIYPAVVAFSPILPSQYQSNIIGHHHQKKHHTNLHRLYFRDAVANRTEESLDTTIPTNIIAVTDEQPITRRTNGVLNRKTYPEEEDTKDKDMKPKSSNRSKINPKRKSAQRLLKAKRLLEMAQVSPSQRLEIMQQDAAVATQQKSSTSNAQTNTTKSFVNINKQVDDPSTSTVVPMGSYSMRFGGYGSLEEELYSMTEMRMADTFDSVDNSVDAKSSLLPGGRWVNEDAGSASDVSSGTSTKSAALSKQQIELEGQAVAEPSVRYDPVAAEKLLFSQPTKWLVRNLQIALPFGYWVAGVLFDNAIGNEKSNRTNRAKQLNSIIASLGPAIIKAGQALASRPDLLPKEYLDELQKLQDNVPTFSNDIAFKTVEEELNKEFDSVFELVEPEPVAAASIGQVYKAKLLNNGQTVAIKIQRPKTEEIVALDLYVLRWWGGVYNEIFKLLGRSIDLQSVMDDFGVLLYQEIDYVAEGANARRFSELYAKDVAVKGVFVPKVYSELTTRKVLTMEWVEGFRLTDNESLEAYNLDRKKLVDTLVQCSLRQILENGYFHADPHA